MSFADNSIFMDKNIMLSQTSRCPLYYYVICYVYHNALKMKKEEELTQIDASAPSFHSLTFQYLVTGDRNRYSYAV